jgi:hypothetical protein
MLLFELAVAAFLFGFVLGKCSPHRWGVNNVSIESRQVEAWRTEMVFPESVKADAVRWQREFAETYNAAKARGLIH